jgi:transcriptional regulator with XRE-family HTH domain
MSKPIAVKQQFMQKLRQLTVQKGMTQSDLGRASGLGRDMISHYMRGVRYPGTGSLLKLATALGVEPGELDPAIGVPDLKAKFVSEIRQDTDNPARVVLHVHESVTMKQALAVMAILHSEDRQS